MSGKEIAATVVGLGVTAVLALAGSLLGLVGTQGLHGNEAALPVFLFVGGILIVVNAVASAVGMLPVYAWGSARRYRAAILGSAIGGIGAGLLFTASMLSRLHVPYLLCLLVGPAAAGAGIVAAGRRP